MADEPRDLVLEHLRGIRPDAAATREEMPDMKARQAAVEDMFT